MIRKSRENLCPTSACRATFANGLRPLARRLLRAVRPQNTPFEASAHMLDIVATAVVRCKLQVLSLFLTYLLSSGVGIFMVH
jgi:hypothetical protein